MCNKGASNLFGSHGYDSWLAGANDGSGQRNNARCKATYCKKGAQMAQQISRQAVWLVNTDGSKQPLLVIACATVERLSVQELSAARETSSVCISLIF